MSKFSSIISLSLILAVAGLVQGSTNGKQFADPESGVSILWYTCTSQGNFPHPSLCDHYVACTTALHAYEMPCAMGHNGRDWYVRDSGPVESESRCDHPALVDCPFANQPTTEDPTTESGGGGGNPTTDDGSNPGDGDTTTKGSAPPSSCSKDTVEGSACDPSQVDCGQCDWCVDMVSYYFRCHQTRSSNPFVPSTGVWVKEQCADGWMVDPTKRLANGAEGGQCIPWDQLDDEVKKDYLEDEACDLDRKLCEYGQDVECTENYWFKLTGSDDRKPYSCNGANDVFDLDTENCRPCSDVPACAGKGKC